MKAVKVTLGVYKPKREKARFPVGATFERNPEEGLTILSFGTWWGALLVMIEPETSL